MPSANLRNPKNAFKIKVCVNSLMRLFGMFAGVRRLDGMRLFQRFLIH